MKIGILTFHQSVNNGAVMQAYSLSKRIQKDYPDASVEILDYRMKIVKNNYSYSLKNYLKSNSAKSFLAKCARLVLDPFTLKRLRYRTRVFNKCIHQLPLSDLTIEDDETEAVIDYVNKNYDVLIVGSDAIWNHVSRGYPNIYLPNAQITCPKLSYAASCYGMDFLACSENIRKDIGQNLNDFSFIGVRDQATENFVVWSGCDILPIHTCDPTAFLDVNDLPIDTEVLKEKLLKRGFDFQKKTIGIMGNSKMLKMIRSFYGAEYQIVSLYEYLRGADVQLYDLTPYEWAYVFRYFELTFTTYFHGTMLSLRNGIPVICIALNTDFAKKHTPKTLDVLKRVGFEDWYFETDYKSLNLPEIKAKADLLLSSDCKEKILKAVNFEAISYNEFDKHLKAIIEHKEQSHD